MILFKNLFEKFKSISKLHKYFMTLKYTLYIYFDRIRPQKYTFSLHISIVILSTSGLTIDLRDDDNTIAEINIY